MPSRYPMEALLVEASRTIDLPVTACTDHEAVDVNHNHVAVKRQRTISGSNPLDNEILKPRSPGLSAFSDYVDLVKRHLMYAVREEVEILKQQIGELVERIVQLEHENTVLKSEAKPETLNKLQQTRGTQPSQASLPGQSTSFTMVPSSQQGGQQATNPMPQTQPSQQYQQTTTPHSMSQAQPSQQYQQTTTPHSVSQTQPSQQYQQTTTPHSVSQAQPSQQYQQTTTPHSMSQAQPSQQYQQTTTSHSVSQAQPSQQTVQTTST